ncbi:flavin reductase family protein [Bacillus sp. BRMEA1]|uniref:flavin reductase family protein n=1 Tax=Neobacillus endophyticus TaxID=2738405 RepID=UPI0015659735|nr:flavin reductase family protein [Neobacillus endophyticus]NRD76754.1 flavin reductase family protein [Neobacillus endophyticus]
METVKKLINGQTTVIRPKILYYGTPVILLNTLNEDETTNISPISSSWALGPFIFLGLSTLGKAYENIVRHRECVMNLPDSQLWEHVERLAPYTGKYPVPDMKKSMGFSFEKEKYSASGLTECASHNVAPTRISECPLQLEAAVLHIRVPEYAPDLAIIETEVKKVHAHQHILLDNAHIDPTKWSPLIYNFRHYFGLGRELGKSFRAET